jgi:Family of unknown function (DUF6790)
LGRGYRWRWSGFERDSGATMGDAIRFVLGNFTLTFLVVGLIASIVSLLRSPHSVSGPLVIEALLFYFLMFSIGFSFFYNFVVHTFFGEMAARLIGWADSPFQAEVGFASLGFSAVGFLACYRSFELRLAAIIGPALFLLGAAGGHIYQIITAGNFAPGNAGVILYTDILIPVIGFALLWLQRRYGARQAQIAN